MTIYTRSGDCGETGLPGGLRVPKDVPRLEACGTLDELNAALGMVLSCAELPVSVARVLYRVQRELLELGAELAVVVPTPLTAPRLGPEQIRALEADIDQAEASLPRLTQFVLPGGSPAGASLHFARTVCRRAERRLVTLWRQSPEPLSPALVPYLNRLGDLLFVLARLVNAWAGQPEATWKGDEPQPPPGDGTT